MGEEELYKVLRSLDIKWTTLEHSPVFTVEESQTIHTSLPGAHTKNLFLVDSGRAFWLVTVHHAKSVDLKKLAIILGAKKFSFGKAEDMERLLSVSPGAVTPLAAINDVDRQVRVVLDESLIGAAMVNVHPLRNSATICLLPADLIRALTHWRHEPAITAIPERT